MNTIITKKIIFLLIFSIFIMPLFMKEQIISEEIIPGDNIVMNPGFEEGVRSHWNIQAACELQESIDSFQGNSACRVFSRIHPWSSVVQEIRSGILAWGPGQYLVSAYVKIDGDKETAQMLLVLNTNYDFDQRWLTTQATINNQSYTKIESIINIPYTVDVTSCLLYLQSSADEFYDFLCDDFSVQKLNGIREPLPIPTADPPEPIKERPDKTLIGAIRWDAWLNPELPTFNLSPSEKQNYIGAQMVRSLSPRQYHFRLPYFGIVLSADSVTFPDYSQKIFDEEMRYAIEAGIDYFMYCWYEDGSGMDMARRFHETSVFRNQVKMSAMWDISSISSAALDTHVRYLKQNYWQKVDGGRPLVYVNRGNSQTVLGVKRFREACINAGLHNPYLVGIRNFGSTPQNIKEYGLDALSDYAIGGGGANPFSYLMNLTMDRWYYEIISGVQYIPLVTAGWDRRPRIDHPVTWEGPTADKNAYIQTATPDEIATLLQKALDFNLTYKEQTGINSVLIYAWNEHDEGGWLCPTIVDTNRDGFPELDKDGKYLRDISRLKAIQKVIKPGAVWTLENEHEISSHSNTSSSSSSNLISYSESSSKSLSQSYYESPSESLSQSLASSLLPFSSSQSSVKTSDYVYKFSDSSTNPDFSENLTSGALTDKDKLSESPYAASNKLNPLIIVVLLIGILLATGLWLFCFKRK